MSISDKERGLVNVNKIINWITTKLNNLANEINLEKNAMREHIEMLEKENAELRKRIGEMDNE